ncbi:hypothetical protein CPC08DRAFT_665167 [Agrocybe pediades]|nr:hypothetical protein CPC08DRAFT_665167 [Agrocybe pediades]
MASFNTPFSEYLHTNYVPNNIDRSHIQQLLSEPEQSLRRLNNEIERLQTVLNDLQGQRDALGLVIHEHYRLLTPIRRLPDDMLSEIFLWCLPDKHNAVMSAAEAPLLLGRVCSRWRYVAYRTPRLWESLHIPIPTPPTPGTLNYSTSHHFQQVCADFEDKFQRHCQAIRQWFARAGSRPLSLSFNPRETFPGTLNNIFIRKYLDLIFEFSNRWRSLEVSITTAEFSTLWATIPASSVPLLESLYLKFSRRTIQPDVWRESGLLRAPQLRVLHLSQFPCRPSTIFVNWSRLTHLSLSDSAAAVYRNKMLTLTEAHGIFAQCKHLVHCSMDIMDGPDTICDIHEIISLPYLLSLDVVDGAKGSATLFDKLDVPSLRAISYHTRLVPRTGPSWRSPLLVLLSRTNGQIKSLATDIHLFTFQEVVECFESLPLLESFTNVRSRSGSTREQTRMRIVCPIFRDIMRVVLDLLTPSPDGMRCLCPRLSTVDLSESLSLRENEALRFILARMEANNAGRMDTGCPTSPETTDMINVAKLKSVSISFVFDQSLDFEEALESYVQEGLKLNLVYPVARKSYPGTINPMNGLVKRGMYENILWSS